ncbi:MAG TPA: NADH-quinone oxidoreductase subunit N [Rectinemataceae bacterium]|nr:NADH-quinone oxidoreductase subunit N [Rectinemataceae bacterium]
MDFSTLNLEIGAAVLGILLLAASLLLPAKKKGGTAVLAAIGFGALLVMSFAAPGGPGPFFKGQYVNDGTALLFKQIFILGAFLVTLMAFRFSKRFEDMRGEFFILMAFSLVGMMGMAGATDFLTLYIALELMSLPLVVLTAFEKKAERSTEAGVKYVLLSAMSSAILLFGLSFLYGAAGSFSYQDVAAVLTGSGIKGFAVFGGIFVLAGLSFKIAAVPFHMWSPDIYEGAPAPVTAFLAVASKAAGFAALARIFPLVLAPMGPGVSVLVVLLASMSMVVGNLSAIPQTNIKRLLAYSSIAHAGYMLLGVFVATKAGTAAVVYYLLLYLVANVGAFTAVTAWSDISGSDEISSFKGMWKRSPFLGAVFIVSLLSLAGIPPAAGFIGKFFLLVEVAKQGSLWLVALAMAMSVVSLYYYVSVIKALVADAPEGDDSSVTISPLLKVVLLASAVATVLLGVLPGPVMDFIKAAIG